MNLLILFLKAATGVLLSILGIGAALIGCRKNRRRQRDLCRNRLPERKEVRERLAKAPTFVLDVETRAVAHEGSDRPGILDMTPTAFHHHFQNS